MIKLAAQVITYPLFLAVALLMTVAIFGLVIPIGWLVGAATNDADIKAVGVDMAREWSGGVRDLALGRFWND